MNVFECLGRGGSWPSSLVHWTQVLVLSECGFESQPGRSRRSPGVSGFAPWAPSRVDLCTLQMLNVSSSVSTRVCRRECVDEGVSTSVSTFWCCQNVVSNPGLASRGAAPVFLDSRLEHPAGWICARCKCWVCRRECVECVSIVEFVVCRATQGPPGGD